MGTYCGSRLPPRLKSVSNKMVVRFFSDHYDHHAGFSANWRRVEGSQETYGYITTPNYPNKYPSCATERLKVISGPKGSKIRLQIVDLDLPNGYGASIVITEGTPGQIWDEPYCLDEDYYDYYYDYYSFKDISPKNRTKIRNNKLRKDAKDNANESDRYLFGAEVLAVIRGNRPTSQWRIESRTNTVSVFWVEYGYQRQRKGVKMAWFLEESSTTFPN